MSKTAQCGKRDVVRVVSFAVTLLMFSVSFGGAKTNAQTAVPRSTPAPPQSPSPDNKDEPPLTSFEEEIRAKRAIKMAEKDHQENVERAKQVADIAKDLQTALKDKKTIDREAARKIERLEKLTKKIRGEAGGEDEEIEITDRPSDINGAIKQIAESAESLSKSVQNTPRQVVSASVIGNANVLLELIKLLRGFDSHP